MGLLESAISGLIATQDELSRRYDALSLKQMEAAGDMRALANQVQGLAEKYEGLAKESQEIASLNRKGSEQATEIIGALRNLLDMINANTDRIRALEEKAS